MANKRDSSRQRRAKENRAQRQALVARTNAAQTPRPDRTPPTRPASRVANSTKAAKPASSANSTPSAKSSAAGGSRSERAAARRAERDANRSGRTQPPPRLGQVPVDVETLEGSWLRKVVQVPGGLQVLMAAILVIVMTVMSCFVHAIPPEGAPREAPGTRTIFDVYGAGALLFLAPPIIIVGNALLYALHAKRRRMWTISAVLMAGFSLLNLQFLFPAGFLGYAVLRARKVEDGGQRRVDSSTDATDDDEIDAEIDTEIDTEIDRDSAP